VGDSSLSERIIGCAIAVHRALGPGLRERHYEEALAIEFLAQRVDFERQLAVPVQYRGQWIGEYRLDFVVDQQIVVEVKSADRLDALFEAQMLTYLRATKLRLGLLLNFNTPAMRSGIRRFIM
jgi:GxxExxY protein